MIPTNDRKPPVYVKLFLPPSSKSSYKKIVATPKNKKNF